jgi:thermopsin
MVLKSTVVAVAVLATIGWMGLAGTTFAASVGPTHASGSVAPSVAAIGSHVAGSPIRAVAPSVNTAPNVASSLAAAALSATRAAGLKSNVVFVPRPSATPREQTAARESGVVTPLYSGTPAPLGLAYYGLNSTGGGTITGTIFNTTGVQASVDANATGIAASDLYQSSPDSYGIQLNSVLTNVTLDGTGHYEFWTQNVVEFYPSSHFMILVTNIWNFSARGASMSPNVFYAHGPDGTDQYAALGYYYAQQFLSSPISYPFNLTLTLNSSISGGRDMVTFGVTLVSSVHPSEDFSAPAWDYAVFNSSKPPAPPSLTVPSNFTADGLQYNPQGLTNDFELDICGPGGGSQADLTAADANLGLATWDGTAWVAVPAAYNYGGETGETATGANVAWSSATGGPAGLAEYGTMTTGPAELTGLWGTGAPQGSFPVTLNVAPGNAFNFFTYDGAPGFTSPNFIVFESAYAPDIYNTTLHLMPGTYNLTTELSDYTPVSQVLVVTGPTTITLTLVPNYALGVYTPLWAFNNAEVAALATTGSGTPSHPYMIDNRQAAPFGPEFGLYNDYIFPVFPGVWFMGTTASTEFDSPANLSAATNDFQFPGPELPATNDLQQWFWNVTDVALLGGGNISGWFGAQTFYPTAFDTFNVIFYESSNNLVASNTFDTQGQALLMFAGGTIFGPLNVGGGNNVVWGNRFVEVPAPTSCPEAGSCLSLLNGALGLGLEVAEGFPGAPDVVYNNMFLTPTTAWELPINLYSGNPEFFTVAWNITPQPAGNAHYAAQFPTYPLQGSILGGSVQGGNYWWDYGNAYNPFNGADNPYGVLPYDENGTTYIIQLYPPSFYSATWIYPGGDFAPILPFALVPVVLHATGLAQGTEWGAEVTNSTGSQIYDNFLTTQSAFLLYLPNGHYKFYPDPVTYYVVPSHGSFTVAGHLILVGVPYHPATGYAILTFRETGLPSGTFWSATVNGTTHATDAFNNTSNSDNIRVQFLVAHGTYNYRIPGIPGWAPSTPSGTLTISGPLTLIVHWTPIRYAVTFTETGLRSGAAWAVRVTGPIQGIVTQTETLGSHATTDVFQLPNGTFTVTVIAPRGYSCSTPSPIVVNGAALAPSVSCSANPPPAEPVAFAPSLGGVGLASAAPTFSSRTGAL